MRRRHRHRHARLSEDGGAQRTMLMSSRHAENALPSFLKASTASAPFPAMVTSKLNFCRSFLMRI